MKITLCDTAIFLTLNDRDLCRKLETNRENWLAGRKLFVFYDTHTRTHTHTLTHARMQDGSPSNVIEMCLVANVFNASLPSKTLSQRRGEADVESRRRPKFTGFVRSSQHQVTGTKVPLHSPPSLLPPSLLSPLPRVFDQHK